MRTGYLSLAVLAIATPAFADIPLRATRVASGLTNPDFVAAAPGDPNRLYITELGVSGTANIKILDLSNNAVNTTPFLTISGLSNVGEGGLLGIAFHPDYATNGKFYVNVVATGGSFGNGITQIREYTRSISNPNVANPTGNTIMSYDQPQTNHNGGWIGFGPNDGYLYIGSGDGGGANDTGTGHTSPFGNGQDITNMKLGKMLRIDVNSDAYPTDSTKNYAIPSSNPFNGTNGDQEIFDYGLRNPFRNSFDRATGDLYIGDVGQGRTEEVDVHKAATPGGLNFGWRAYEGSTPRPGNTDPLPTNHTPPIAEYDHPSGASRSITGGVVYRGTENSALAGTYFYADYVSNQIYSLVYNGTAATKQRELTGLIPTDVGSIGSIVGFGEDAQGRIYIVDIGGEIFRIVPAKQGDSNLDKTVDVADLGVLASNWQTTAVATWAMGDFTDDGHVDVADLGLLASNWQSTGGGPTFGEAMGLVGLPEPTICMTALGLVGFALRRTRR